MDKLDKKHKIFVISIHLSVQLAVYGFLAYIHLMLFMILGLFRQPPKLSELIVMQSSSVIIALVIATIITMFWRNALRLNAIIVGVVILLSIISIIFLRVDFYY